MPRFPFFSVSEVVNSYFCCTKINFFFHRKGPTPEVLQEASVGISESAVVPLAWIHVGILEVLRDDWH